MHTLITAICKGKIRSNPTFRLPVNEYGAAQEAAVDGVEGSDENLAYIAPWLVEDRQIDVLDLYSDKRYGGEEISKGHRFDSKDMRWESLRYLYC